jgi:ABC-type uncharacterized transport system fused permease/ATPase subunit
METKLYETCQELGIAYITICHRPALKRFHDVNLNLTGDGQGGWEVHQIPHNVSNASDDEGVMSTPQREKPSMHVLPNVSIPSSDSEKYTVARSLPYTHLRETLPLPRRSVLSQVSSVLAIVLPGSWFSLGGLLVAIGLRTATHEAFGRISGSLVAATLARDHDAFRSAMMVHFALDVVTSFVDESTTWLQNRVGVQWSESLSRHAVDLYFRDSAYYNARAIDRRIRDPDQRITQEVTELAQSMASIFAASLTPLLDTTYFGWRLYSQLGVTGVTPLALYAGGASVLLGLALPDHNFLNTKEKELESQYRFVQTRLK